MTRPLFDLIAAGAPGARLRFAQSADKVSAATLMEAGSRLQWSSGAATALIATNDQVTVEVVLGAICQGTRIVSLPPPGRGQDTSSYVEFVDRARKHHAFESVVARPDIAALLDGAGVKATPNTERRAAALAAPASDGFSLIQYTSGSTQSPKAILHSEDTLAANLEAIIERLDPRPGDGAVSWLPLSHDMGLVGMLFTGISCARADLIGTADIVMLDPQQFLRRPSIWMEALSETATTITATPDFGLRLATAAYRAGVGLDLSRLRCVIVGSEIVRHDTLTEFSAAFRQRGFSSSALCPSYGLAEAGVAVTMTSPQREWHALDLSTAALTGRAIAGVDHRKHRTRVVSCGAALADYEVRVAGRDVGRIEIAGPSLGSEAITGNLLAQSGWLATDDVGFLSEGDLFVCGRDDDYVVAQGRNLYAPAIEQAVAEVSGVRSGRAVVAGLVDGRWAVVLELDHDAGSKTAAAIERAVRVAAVEACDVQPDLVVVLQRGELPMTPSGKVQRNATALLLVDRGLV